MGLLALYVQWKIMDKGIKSEAPVGMNGASDIDSGFSAALNGDRPGSLQQGTHLKG